MSKNGTLLPEPLPAFLTAFPNLTERITQLTGLDANQVLVNEYQPGQGISPHEDGPAFAPLVATVSLGSHTVIGIHHYLSSSPSPPMSASSGPIAAIPLAHLLVLPRSLLILSSSLYTTHLHGISPLTEDVVRGAGEGEGVLIANGAQLGNAGIEVSMRKGTWQGTRGVRTSLTFRRAEKVLKGGMFSMGGGGMRRV